MIHHTLGCPKMRHVSISDSESVESNILDDDIPAEDSFTKKMFVGLTEELLDKNQVLHEEVTFLRKQVQSKDEILSKLLDLSPLQSKLLNIENDLKEVQLENENLREIMAYLVKQVNRKNSTIMSVSESGLTIAGEDDGERIQCVVSEDIEEILKNMSATETANNSSKLERPSHVTVRKPKPKVSYAEQMKYIREKRHAEYLEYKDKPVVVGRELGEWEKHTRGFASQYMRKCDYGGGGLGKKEDGIVNPIEVSAKKNFGEEVQEQTSISYSALNEDSGDGNSLKVRFASSNDRHQWPANTTLIAGSSIVSGIQESRLRKYKCKVCFFPGCYD